MGKDGIFSVDIYAIRYSLFREVRSSADIYLQQDSYMILQHWFLRRFTRFISGIAYSWVSSSLRGYLALLFLGQISAYNILKDSIAEVSRIFSRVRGFSPVNLISASGNSLNGTYQYELL